MFLKKLKDALTPSLSTKIGQQIRAHQGSIYSFRDEIVLVISQDYEGPHISATLKSTNPDASGFCASGQVWFYKYRVDTLFEALNKLTSEVGVATINYPNLKFYRWLQIPVKYSAEIVKDWAHLAPDLKVRMIKEGLHGQTEIINLYEIYSGGSWVLADCPAWNN